MGVICTCLPALSALLIRVWHEYSSNKATSDYKLSTMQNNQSKPQRSKKQMSVQEAESDEDVLMYNAQGNPRIETTIHGDTERQIALLTPTSISAAALCAGVARRLRAA